MMKFKDRATTSRIKVLHVIDSLAPGGAERVLVELVNNFGQDIVPEVCVTRYSDMQLAEKIKDGISIYQLNRTSRWDWTAFKMFGQIVRQDSIDIIHCHGYSSSQFVLVAKILNRLSVPFIMHAHSSERPDFFTQLVSRFGPVHFIGVAPQLTIWARDLLGFAPEHITMLENAINLAAYRNLPSLDLRSYFDSYPSKVGLVIANVRPVKDLETLFHALAQCNRKEDIGILIAGSLTNTDYVTRCRKLLLDLRLSDQVTFLGTQQDLPRLLSSADFGILSSQQESGPIALLEYMAAGIPFIVTRVGQIGKSVFAAGLSSTVLPKDHVALARALDELLKLSSEEFVTRGEAGREFVERNFSITTQIERLQKLYQYIAIRNKFNVQKKKVRVFI